MPTLSRITRPALAMLACAVLLSAQDTSSWSERFTPHHVAGNVYYVGTRGLASYLITTPEGHILINSSLESSVPMIRASIEKLGFQFSGVKVLLVSHAHWDHNAGSALVKELTGANYMVMEQDVAVTEDGGKSDFQYGSILSSLYRPVKVDRILHDGDEISLGGTTLKAHLTPGHTKGCTTWTMTAREGAKSYDIVIVGSPNVNDGYRLVKNDKYPDIAADFAKTFRILKSLHCDIFLGAHGDYYGMEAKVAKMRPDGPNAFIDPEGYRKWVAEKEQMYLRALERQR